MAEDIMKVERVLPEDFTGVFYFTNTWEDKDFVGKWGNREYVYPANSTSPMVIPEHSPLEIQQIRKKFAKDWAEQDFFRNNPQYKRLMGQERSPEGTPLVNSFHMAGTYNLNDLAEGIQKCLTPLAIRQATVRQANFIPTEDKLTRNEDNELNTVAVDKKVSLKNRALEGKGLPINEQQ